MSDAFSGIDAAVAAAVAADPGAYTDEPVVAPAAVAPVVAVPVQEPDPDQFPRDYVEALRRENADFRARMNEYLDIAGPLTRFEDEQDIRAAHALIEALGNPDEFVGLLEQLEALPDFAEAKARRRAPQQPQPVGLDPRAVEQIVEQRLTAFQEAQAQQAIQAQFMADARSLGYNPDADMASDVAGALAFENLLTVAARVTGGDVQRAHALIAGQQVAPVAARPVPGVLPVPVGQPPAQGIDMSQYTGKGALDRLDKDLRAAQREGRL